MQVYWIAGRFNKEQVGWEILGLYSQKTSAVGRCRTNNDFIGPITLDEDLPEEVVDWVGVEYPMHAGSR